MGRGSGVLAKTSKKGRGSCHHKVQKEGSWLPHETGRGMIWSSRQGARWQLCGRGKCQPEDAVPAGELRTGWG